MTLTEMEDFKRALELGRAEKMLKPNRLVKRDYCVRCRRPIVWSADEDQTKVRCCHCGQIQKVSLCHSCGSESMMAYGVIYGDENAKRRITFGKGYYCQCCNTFQVTERMKAYPDEIGEEG